MSATISSNNLKFVIFGSGHDYTLADSGEGEKVFFSHYYVPLGAENYAGFFYFMVPDENKEFFDAVKDDIAHCTFEPAIGATFNTVGEQTVKVHYRREYVYPEETLLVEKELEQKIEVVDHGAVSSTSSHIDIYSDGYGFIHPTTTSTVQEETYTMLGSGIKKISSIPWRKGSSLYNFISSSILEDVTELEYAEVSSITDMRQAFSGCEALETLEGLDGWITSKVMQMQSMFEGCHALEDISALKSWDTENVGSMEAMFKSCEALEEVSDVTNWDTAKVGNFKEMFMDTAITDLTQLSSLDVSSATYLSGMFKYCDFEELDGLGSWDVTHATQMDELFYGCDKLTDISAIEDWDVSNVRNMAYLFYGNVSLEDYTPLTDWNTSSLYNASYMFAGSNALAPDKAIGGKIKDVDFLANWDVSKVGIFEGMFQNQWWLSDISGLADWNTSNGQNFLQMFEMDCGLRSLSALAGWNMARATDIRNMFTGYMIHSSGLNEDLFQIVSYYISEDGTRYAMSDPAIGTVTDLTTDCSALEGWTVNIASPTGVVPNDATHYINPPSWR